MVKNNCFLCKYFEKKGEKYGVCHALSANEFEVYKEGEFITEDEYIGINAGVESCEYEAFEIQYSNNFGCSEFKRKD